MCKFCEDYKRMKNFAKLVDKNEAKIILIVGLENSLPNGMNINSKIESDYIYFPAFCPMCGRKLVNE